MAGASVPDRPDSHNASPCHKVHGSRRSAHPDEEGPGAGCQIYNASAPHGVMRRIGELIDAQRELHKLSDER
jgi:hypothetical protein